MAITACNTCPDSLFLLLKLYKLYFCAVKAVVLNPNYKICLKNIYVDTVHVANV